MSQIDNENWIERWVKIVLASPFNEDYWGNELDPLSHVLGSYYYVSSQDLDDWNIV